jgi:hypothetical protein
MLASCKLVRSNPCSKGSRTAKSGTDEQEGHRRLLNEDKHAQQCKVQRIQNRFKVDATGIGGRNMLLPGEILLLTKVGKGSQQKS